MKLLLYFCIFVCFAAIGYYIYLNYKRRKTFYENFLAFCGHLTVEINFSKHTLSQIIDTYKSSYALPFASMLDKYKNLVEGRSDITRDLIEQIIWNGSKQAERNVITDFFLELGKHSAQEECEKIKTKQIQLQSFYDASLHALKHEASIYFKICILVGIAAVILLL